jgi:hypothetical protein
VHLYPVFVTGRCDETIKEAGYSACVMPDAVGRLGAFGLWRDWSIQQPYYSDDMADKYNVLLFYEWEPRRHFYELQMTAALY